MALLNEHVYAKSAIDGGANGRNDEERIDLASLVVHHRVICDLMRRF
jgi:hypothetical protein